MALSFTELQAVTDAYVDNMPSDIYFKGNVLLYKLLGGEMGANTIPGGKTIDAILEFRAGIAEQSLHQLLQRGNTPAYLMVMLARQIQRIVRIKELRSQRKSETETRNKLGLHSDFAWRKTAEQAERYPLERIRNVYNRLLEADLSIKTGKYESELALNILIAELCQ